MTLLGKSFSVVILLLTFAFMILALAVNASHRNWRDAVIGETGLKAQIETIDRTNKQLVDARDRTQASLDREQISRRTAIASLQTQLDQVSGLLATTEAKSREQEAQITILTQTDEARAKELQRLTDENVKLRESIKVEQADRDKLFAETLKLTDEMNTLRGLVLLQQERNNQLMAQVTRYKEVVDARGIDVNEPLDGAPPERNGKVLVVNRPKNMVLLSIGFDEGLRKGHTLEVTRGNRYIGKVRVVSTEPDRSVAEIVRDNAEGIIQENDRVDTTFE
jgi:hypothetical protein